MKKITLLALSAMFALSIQAQQNVYLKIDHFLGSNAFAMNTAATNNLGNDFNVTRLQYYIAEIKIVHDGGQVTDVPNKWILVNANATVNELLGSFSITAIEAIKFGIGVEQSYNHLDPASYAMSHPLAPKSPSMHWGWSAGYRFVAMEGNSGASLNQTYEFHALGDANYYTFTIPTSGATVGSNLEITVNADYEKAFYNIDLGSGNNIIHGEVGKAAELLINFSNNVFTSSEGNSAIGIIEDNEPNFAIGPNPSSQSVLVSAEAMNGGSYDLVVTDITGKIVAKSSVKSGGKTQLQFNHQGVYFISILQNGARIKVEKVLIYK